MIREGERAAVPQRDRRQPVQHEQQQRPTEPLSVARDVLAPERHERQEREQDRDEEGGVVENVRGRPVRERLKSAEGLQVRGLDLTLLHDECHAVRREERERDEHENRGNDGDEGVVDGLLLRRQGQRVVGDPQRRVGVPGGLAEPRQVQLPEVQRQRMEGAGVVQERGGVHVHNRDLRIVDDLQLQDFVPVHYAPESPERVAAEGLPRVLRELCAVVHRHREILDV
mmetsp:Transcript_47535/g.79643  ORF Transcript_47535/g.79643 Transcript_47535/m.79643 type:complete len:227 (-) Transcript_47535:29-709(-)